MLEQPSRDNGTASNPPSRSGGGEPCEAWWWGRLGTDGACAPSVGFAATSPVKHGGGPDTLVSRYRS